MRKILSEEERHKKRIQRSKTYQYTKELSEFLKQNPTHKEILNKFSTYPFASWGSGAKERFAKECIDYIYEEEEE